MKNLIALLPLLLLGCTKHEPPPQEPAAPQPTLRFELVQLGSMRRDQYLLDKQTGQVWQSTCLAGAKGPDCDYAAWIKQDVEDVNITRADMIDWIEKNKPAKKGK